MSSSLRNLVDDLKILVPIVPLGSNMSSNAVYTQLRMLLADFKDNPELDALSAEELRALHNFAQVVNLAGSMDGGMMRKHIGAAWRGAAKQAVLKTSLGKQIADVYHELMLGGLE